MRILWLTKRRHSSRDLIDDRFGRYYHLPRELRQLGLEVHLHLMDYRGGTYKTLELEGLKVSFAGPLSYKASTKFLIERLRPTLIVGAGDLPFIFLAFWYARQFQAAFAADLHDDYRTYQSAKIPGLYRMLSSLAHKADCLSVVSQTLQRKFSKAHVVVNGVDRALFFKRPLESCRKAWQWPSRQIAFGYGGALNKNRGIATLFKAWESVRSQISECHLYLAGPKESKMPPLPPQCTWVGHLPQVKIPDFIGALNAALVLHQEDGFGRAAFPYKLAEAVACGVPVVVPRLGAAAEWLLPEAPQTFDSKDPHSLASAMESAIRSPTLASVNVPSWKELAQQLAGHYESSYANFIR